MGSAADAVLHLLAQQNNGEADCFSLFEVRRVPAHWQDSLLLTQRYEIVPVCAYSLTRSSGTFEVRDLNTWAKKHPRLVTASTFALRALMRGGARALAGADLLDIPELPAPLVDAFISADDSAGEKALEALDARAAEAIPSQDVTVHEALERVAVGSLTGGSGACWRELVAMRRWLEKEHPAWRCMLTDRWYLQE